MVDRNEHTIIVGQRSVTLNEEFIKRFGAGDNLELLKDLFTKKLELYYEIDATDARAELGAIAKRLTANEFLIQEAYNLEPNIDYHRFWEVPKCICPKLDNEDSWGCSLNYVNMSCPIHGKESQNES